MNNYWSDPKIVVSTYLYIVSGVPEGINARFLRTIACCRVLMLLLCLDMSKPKRIQIHANKGKHVSKIGFSELGRVIRT